MMLLAITPVLILLKNQKRILTVVNTSLTENSSIYKASWIITLEEQFEK
jgi:hypothetical protein